MSYRWIFAVMVTVALVGGCSSPLDGIQKSGAPSSKASASGSSPSSSGSAPSESSPSDTDSPSASGDSSKCLDVGEASIQLLTSSDKSELRKAADTLEKYNPPSDVKDAIEHFVSSGGADFDDPNLTANTTKIKDWIEQVCPI